MNIIQVGPYPLSADCIRGGVESSVYGLAQTLARAGHSVEVFDFPRIGGKDSSETDGLLTVRRYANNSRHNEDAVGRASEMGRHIVALRPDVVHLHGTGKLSGFLYQSVKKCGIPAVLTVHGLVQEEKRQAFLRKPSLKHLYQYIARTRAEWETLNAAERIIVDTPYVEKMLAKYARKGKIAQLPQIHVIPQGVNAAYYGLSCNPESRTVLSVGALSPRKGHLYLVDMFNTLRGWGTQARLCIMGSLADAGYHRRLLEKIAASPYRADITLLTDVSRQELFAALEDAKLFVLHSREESQGIVFAEAMAAGLPVVATRVGGVPDVVQSGRTGFLCDFGDTRTMAEMAERLLTDRQLWLSFSGYARSAALKYDWEKIAKQICSLYNTP